LPIFSCSNSAHQKFITCPVASSLSNFQPQGFVIHVVNCLWAE
jgi:hypothetical protein